MRAKCGLLERQGQFAAITDALASAEEGTGQLLVLEGRPGIGKSALLGVAGEEARSRGFEVLSARGRDLERDFAFGAVLQLIEPSLASRSPDQREELLSGAAGLVRVLVGGGPGGTDPHGLIHGLYWLVSNLCGLGDPRSDPHPVALMVDDAHWVDDASLRFLIHLADRIQDLPVALMVAVRRREPASAARLLERLVATNGAQVVEVPPLSEAAVTELVHRRLWADAGPAVCRSCTEVTGGNPFLLEALLAELRSTAAALTEDTAARLGQLAPSAVLRAVIARLARLTEPARNLARAVAVLGEDTPLRHAAGVANLSEPEAAEAVAALVAADILAAREPLSFVHPLIRSSVAEEINGFDRGRLHLAAARLLRDEGASVERVAVHLMGAAPTGEPWAADVLRGAAAMARDRGAAGVEADLLLRALEEPIPPEVRADVLSELGAAEASVGRPTAVDRLNDALDLATERSQRQQIAVQLAFMLYMAGRRAEVVRVVQRLSAEVSESRSDGPEIPELRALQALVALFPEPGQPEIDGRLDHAVAGLDPERPADRLVLSLVAVQLAMEGRPADQVRALTTLAAPPCPNHKTSDPDPGRGRLRDTALISLAVTLVHIDDLESCQQVLDDAIDDARRRGSHRSFVTLTYLRAWPLYLQGRLSEVISDVEAARPTIERGWRAQAASASAVLAHAYIARGDLDAADRVLRSASDAGLDNGAHEKAVLTDARGTLLLESGDAAAALAHLLPCRQLHGRADMVAALRWRIPAALAALAVGEGAAARELAEEELDLARRVGTSRALGMALRTQGLVVGGASGLELLEQSAARLRDSPARLERELSGQSCT